MARCNNEELIRKVSLAKLKKSTEIDLALLRDLPDCRIIKAKAYTAISRQAVLLILSQAKRSLTAFRVMLERSQRALSRSM